MAAWSYPVVYQVVRERINVLVDGGGCVQRTLLRLKYRIQTFSYLRDRSHINAVTPPHILGNRGGVNPSGKSLSMQVYITHSVCVLIITTLVPIG